MKKLLAELGEKGISVKRYKGLGEMNAQQLWDTTMNPENRIFKKVMIEDAMEANEIFKILMGKDVEARKDFIKRHAREVKNLDI
ncbi:MAG: DNA gyrase subunit B [Methanoregulaceae archaeon PtaB.Bin108]|nr:MAG: DNA gyrase subunit B [Methanoregulaceae archaeon PtaB.Bin108]